MKFGQLSRLMSGAQLDFIAKERRTNKMRRLFRPAVYGSGQIHQTPNRSLLKWKNGLGLRLRTFQLFLVRLV